MKLPVLNDLKAKFMWEQYPPYAELESGMNSWYLLPDGSYLGSPKHHGQLAAYALGRSPDDFDEAEIKADTWDTIRAFSRKFKALRITVTGDSLNVDALFRPTSAQMRELARLGGRNKKVYWAGDAPMAENWDGKGTFPDFQRWLDKIHDHAQNTDKCPEHCAPSLVTRTSIDADYDR